jgi:hypothetical protein
VAISIATWRSDNRAVSAQPRPEWSVGRFHDRELPIYIVLTEGMEYGAILPPYLWHYTNRVGLQGILESRSFWGTNFLYLEDLREFRFAGDVMRLVLDQVIDEEAAPEIRNELARLQQLISSADRLVTPSLYICSFTSSRDNRDIWRLHTRSGDAYNLGIPGFYLFEHGLSNWQLRPCVYQDTEQRVLVHEVLERRLKRLKEGDQLRHVLIGLAHEISGLAPMLKHPDFTEEQEWRMIRYPNWFVRFPDERGPEVQIAPNGVPHATFRFDDPLPPVRITIGPGPRPQLDENDVIAMAAKSRIVASAKRSEILLRDLRAAT